MARESMWEIPLMGPLQRTADSRGLGRGVRASDSTKNNAATNWTKGPGAPRGGARQPTTWRLYNEGKCKSTKRSRAHKMQRGQSIRSPSVALPTWP
eukprot:4726751-Heterocapsa_arctica.AAC.1